MISRREILVKYVQLQVAREEGIEERIRMLIELVLEKTYTVEQAAQKANMNIDEFQKILDIQSKK